MKNIFFNCISLIQKNVLLFSFFLLISQVAIGQTITSVTGTNGTCQANASIEVTTTGCSGGGWTAEIVKTTPGSIASPLIIPSTGTVLFSSLEPGSYKVSITNGFTTIQYANNPVILTTDYVNNLAVLNSSTGTPPYCANSSDATYTVNISGGVGPFVYTLAATDGTNVVTGTSHLRSYTFTGLPGGVVRNLSVTDQVNGGAGCEYTVRKQVTIPAQTTNPLSYGFRHYNFIRDCDNCTVPKMFINLDNLSPARRDILLEPGNAKITIAGVDYALTYIPAQNRFTYDPVATGGPNLIHGMTISTSFNWGCSILTKTSTVTMSNDALNVYSNVLLDPATCTNKYKIVVIGDADTFQGYRDVYFCPTNTVVIEKRVATNPDAWQVVSGSDITPDPATLTTGLPVVGAFTSIIPSAANAFFVYQPGTYRVTASDACHSVSKTIDIVDNIPIKSLSAYTRVSVLSGTVGLEVNTNNYTGSFPMTIQIDRVDGQTSMPITASGPLSYAGNYTVTFPIIKTFASNPSWFNIMDLPPGEYKVKFTDACSAATGNIKEQTINLTNLAAYDPQVSVVEGCLNSNTVNFNLNVNSYTYKPPTARLINTNGSVIKQVTTGANGSGSFTNVPSGDYIVDFTYAGVSGSLFSTVLTDNPIHYSMPISVAPYKHFEIETSTVKCNLNDAKGIISVQAVNGTVIYPLTYSLFSTANSTTPVQGPFTITSPTTATSYDFVDVPEGQYVVRIDSPCFSQDKNVTVSSISTVPTAKVSNLTVCPGSPTTFAILSPSSSMYDITWTDNNNVVIGTGMPLALTPAVTTEYTATYTLKGCANPTIYESKVTVKVTDNVDLTKTVSDIDLCLNSSPNRNITVSNSQLEFTYELTDSNGFSFTPPVTAAGTGNDLVLTIPSSAPLVAGTPFKVKAGNGNTGCSGFLTDVVSITASKNNQNLAVRTISPVCPGTASKITVEGFESGVTYQIQKNGTTLTPAVVGLTSGLNKEFTIPANQLVSGTNTFTVITSGSGCTNGELINKGVIIVNQAPAITGTLGPIVIEGCDDVAAPAAYTTVAQLEVNGVTITDAETADNLLVVTYSDSPMVGLLSKVFTRTYTITDPSCSGSSTVAQNITLNITTPVKPTITAGSSTTFCIGGSVVLTSSATSGNQWFKDGVAIFSANSSTYTATTSGTYTVNVTNSNGCSSPVSTGEIVTVNVLPVATINGGTTLAFVNCAATTVDLTASNGIAFEWQYSLDNVAPFSVLSATTQTIPASNLGFYKVKVTNSTNCEAVSQVTHVVATPAVTAAQLEACVGNMITLTANATSFVSPTFQWKKDGNTIPSATTPSWDVTENGEYTVDVTDGRPLGSGNIGTQTSCGANVHFNPLPVVDAGTNFTITCATNASGLTIGETPETGFDYVWTSTNGISGLSNATIANPVAHPTATTTYTVRKTNQTTLCWKEDSITITVDTTPPTANAGTDFTRTCVDNTLGKEIGVAPISGQTYSWFPTTGLDDATKANPIAIPTATTTYTVTVTNSTNGCTAQDTVVATVDISAPTANAGTNFTKTCATNPTGKLIGAAAISGETYSWLPITGLSDATSANPNANPSLTTLYALTATKIATGCTTTASVTATVLETPNPIALSTTIANNCPAETVDLTTIQPAVVSGIVYEWWTGTATTRGAQITNPTTYSTPGTIYLWSKTSSEACYNTSAFEVNVVMNVCCMPSVGQLANTNNVVHYAPADITSLSHTNYPTPSVVRYVVVNDLDGKIKQINTTKPEFTQLKAGNYTVHALVFGPTVAPTGLVAGNKLSQVQPLCGTSATFALVVQSVCSPRTSYTETLPNAQHYALLDVTTNKFVQVNTNGTFTMIHTGMPHQIIGFNYTGTATGIQVGGTLSTVTATNLDVTAGSIISGCTAVVTQIDGNIYNDKDKKCIEGLNNQQGLPATTLYAKLLDSNNQVIEVSALIESPNFTFSMSPDLLDGTYSIILDDNDVVSDAVATYPNSWKGNTQTFTVASGQIVEQLSNTANFVPMCMQAATNKPILKPTANLVGNTYNYCQGTIASSLSVDAIAGATVHWYTQAIGGTAKSAAPIPNTAVVGTTTCYVSQSVNGAESDRTEVIIAVHALPEQPTAISGNNLIAAGSIQSYSVVNSATSVTYNWILPTDWTGTSTTKDINVAVGTQAATIGVTAISSMGCVSPVQELAVRVVIEDDIEVYNSLSPNGDGDNDIFRIRNIDFYPENTMSIYNRWGIEVYSVISYGQKDNFFKGFSDGRSTLNRGVELPEGTYFYMLTYKNTKGIEKNLSGYLYIKQ